MTLNNGQQWIYMMPDQPQTNYREVMTMSAAESTTSAADQCQPRISLLKVLVPV
uniref:Uncharacterized protein n=1 Tax=Romanomermis culicivorax TaxID=13658 RepID=A0A915KMD3_ROMCU